MLVLDLFTYEWTELFTYGDRPKGRLQHSCILHQDIIIVFGGEPDRQSQLNDLYYYEITNNTWREIKPKGMSIMPRVSASSTLFNDHIYYFGGFDGKKWRNDTFTFDIKQQQWNQLDINMNVKQQKVPDSRCRHSMVLYQNRLVIFGGNDYEKSFNDVYSLDLSIKSQSKYKYKDIKQDYKELMYDQIYSDVQFIFNTSKQTINAHRCILSQRSEYFRSLLLSTYIVLILIRLNE